MTKYSPEIVKKICSLLEKDSYTIKEVCANVGINEDTYYDWQKNKSDFSEAIKKARHDYDSMILVECEKSLTKLIKGFEVEESKTTFIEGKDGLPRVKEKQVTKKYFPPNLGALIHFQTNKAPEQWKNRQNIDHTSNGNELVSERVIILEKASDKKKLEELRKFAMGGEQPAEQQKELKEGKENEG
ncbi:MAG TPA: phBC6A51 family helix-turn-helix protein [Tenuifilaceae bacterium]|nr:phBC6A51 family helix-turn-helix protein [Tenuifilaceae bacterium]